MGGGGRGGEGGRGGKEGRREGSWQGGRHCRHVSCWPSVGGGEGEEGGGEERGESARWTSLHRHVSC